MSDDGDVGVTEAIATLPYESAAASQQLSAIDARISLIRIRKMLTDVTRRDCTEQGITQGMQNNVAIRMCKQRTIVGYRYAAKNNSIQTLPWIRKSVHIEAMSDPHQISVSAISTS
ncbi:MAG: hypothetical protein ACJARU_001853 [Congregibacter sp.]